LRGLQRVTVTVATPPPMPVMSHLHHDVLVALMRRSRLRATVPAALDLVELNPLVSAGQFAGDLLRGLMEVPGNFWVRHPILYARYRAALRAGAAQRRTLPPEQRLDFWEPILLDTAYLDRGAEEPPSGSTPGD
jgi:hypothetical protein